MRYTATSELRDMCTLAAQCGDSLFRPLVTKMIDGVCVQAQGRPVWRNTQDGMQKTVQINWFIDCKRSSRAKVYKRFGQEVK